MSELLKPLTRLLERMGIDPILFSIAITLIVIFISRKDYLNWEKQTKTRKSALRWYVIGLVLLIVSWFLLEFKPS